MKEQTSYRSLNLKRFITGGDLADQLWERLAKASARLQATDPHGRRARSIQLKRQIASWLQAQDQEVISDDSAGGPRGRSVARPLRTCDRLGLNSAGPARPGVRPGVIQEWD